MPTIESISAVTLATHDMARAVAFYEKLGFVRAYGGGDAAFTSFAVGRQHLNLILVDSAQRLSWWGRTIFYVDDVDGFWRQATAAGIAVDGRPQDAPWGERYFHVTDPDGHELSFAVPLPG
ncbi:MAG TPA: VOC family protein [Kiloniellales bacterium]|nr:VOC family protein [Kiloniellales bacterium]